MLIFDGAGSLVGFRGGENSFRERPRASQRRAAMRQCNGRRSVAPCRPMTNPAQAPCVVPFAGKSWVRCWPSPLPAWRRSAPSTPGWRPNRTQERIERQLRGVVGVLTTSNFPLTAPVLQKMRDLSSAEFVLTDAAGQAAGVESRRAPAAADKRRHRAASGRRLAAGVVGGRRQRVFPHGHAAAAALRRR